MNMLTLQMPATCPGDICACSSRAHTGPAMTYVEAVRAAIAAKPALVGKLPGYCPECETEPYDESVADFRNEHVMLGDLVVIACEGYWTLDPNLVGIDAPHWTDAEH